MCADIELANKELESALQAEAKAKAQLGEMQSQYADRVEEAKSAQAAKLQVSYVYMYMYIYIYIYVHILYPKHPRHFCRACMPAH
jgi:hypothetical protein